MCALRNGIIRFKTLKKNPDLSENQSESIQIVLETFKDPSGGSSTIHLPIFTMYLQCHLMTFNFKNFPETQHLTGILFFELCFGVRMAQRTRK